MIAPLAQFIDWSALQVAYAVVGLRHVPKPKWKLEEALELPHGHVGTQLKLSLLGRVLRWLTTRLDEAVEPDRMTPPNAALEPTPITPCSFRCGCRGGASHGRRGSVCGR
jgi:hypothetical protein